MLFAIMGAIARPLYTLPEFVWSMGVLSLSFVVVPWVALWTCDHGSTRRVR